MRIFLVLLFGVNVHAAPGVISPLRQMQMARARAAPRCTDAAQTLLKLQTVARTLFTNVVSLDSALAVALRDNTEYLDLRVVSGARTLLRGRLPFAGDLANISGQVNCADLDQVEVSVTHYRWRGWYFYFENVGEDRARLAPLLEKIWNGENAFAPFQLGERNILLNFSAGN